MRKFIINYFKQTSIIEVEFEKVSAIEDIAVLWLKEDEWKGKISKPTSLYEKHPVTGKLSQPIWCWHAFYDSPEDCFTILRTNTRKSLIKFKTQEAIKNDHDPSQSLEINEEDLEMEVEEMISKIQVVYLQ
jgi:hypothetical protein